MNRSDSMLESILSQKKELFRLFLIATVLALAVGVLSGLATTQTLIPPWATGVVATFIMLGSLALLASDLRSSLRFEDRISAVLIVDPERNALVAVKDYDFSEDLVTTLRAVKAENQSIYSEWTREPLVPLRIGSESTALGQPTKEGSPTFVAIVKVNDEHSISRRSEAARLLEEMSAFILVEELSMHLSTYFNDSEGDERIAAYRRDDIPGALLRNRVLNLLSTPIEQRDVFLSAYPRKEQRPDGEIHALWGSDGSRYSLFELVLPTGTTVQAAEHGSIRIATKRFSIEIAGKYSGTTAVVSRAFLARYVGVDPNAVACLNFSITLTGRINPLSLFTSKGWQYYLWLGSFRETLRKKCDFEVFQQEIHWGVIEPFLFAIRQQEKLQDPQSTNS